MIHDREGRRRRDGASSSVALVDAARVVAGGGRGVVLALLGALLAILAALAPAAAHARPRLRPPPAPTADDLASLVARPVEVHFPVAIDPARAVPAALRDLPAGATGPAAPRTRGPVVVGPRRGALVQVAALGVLRLRARAPRAGEAAPPPRLRRLQGEPGGTWLAIDEVAREVSPGTWLIEQPPGSGGTWLISAARPLEVAVEAVEARVGDLIWDDRAAAILAWIDEGGPPPALPEVAGVERLRRALLVDAEIAAEIARRSPGDRPLQAAARAWRRAAALQHLALVRDLRRADFGLEVRPRALAGTAEIRRAGAADPPWRRRRGAGRWSLELVGPGLLVVDARLIGGGEGGELVVTQGGRLRGRADLLAPRAGPLHAPEDMSQGNGLKGHDPEDMYRKEAGGPADAPLPEGLAVDDDGEAAATLADAVGAPLGPPAQVRVALAPGRRRYELRFTGREGALRLRAGRDNPTLAAALRGETVGAALARARRALARSSSPDAPLLADLIAAVAGEPPRARPRLRREGLEVPADRAEEAGAGEEAGPYALHTRVAAARDLAAPAGIAGGALGLAAPRSAAAPQAPSRSPILALAADLLRARRTDLDPAARRRLARDLARAADRAASEPLAWEARAAGLELIAGLDAPSLVRALGGSEPARAPTAVLHQLARAIEGPPLLARSPALALLGRARRLRPLDPEVRAVLRERWRGGSRWSTIRADEPAGDPWQWIEPVPAAAADRSPPASALWTWPSGQVHRVRAEASTLAPDHPALLHLYARSDAPAAPLSVTVDGRAWHTRALQPLQALRVALPPGDHDARVDAPAGARIWSSMPPRPGQAADARLLRLWPLRRGEALRFVLPGGDAPGYARIELRGVAPDLPARVRLQVTPDVGEARELEVELVAGPAGIAPIDAPAAAGARATVVLPVAPRARALTLRLQSGAAVVAAAASIRTTLGPEPPPAAARPRAAPVDEAALLAEVAAASRGLQERPGDRRLALRRAAALLELDQRGLALVDWARVVDGPLPPDLLADALALAARLDAHDAPRHIDLRVDAPVLVEPALAAVVGDDPGRLEGLAPAIEAAWAGGPEAGLRALGVAPPAPARPSDVSLPLPPGLAAASIAGAQRGRASVGLGALARATAPVLALAAEAGEVAHDRSDKTDQTAPGGRQRGATGGPGGAKRGAAHARPGPKRPAATAAHGPDVGARGAPQDPVAGALAATWLADAGHPRASALLWARVAARSGAWQADLAAVHGFLAALDRPGSRADGAGLAHGIAAALAPSVRTPAVRRLRAVAAARSRWSRVQGAEQGGGSERLHVPRASSLPAPSVAVTRALLTPPWPHDDGVVLSPGHATVLEVRRAGPRAVEIDLWCQALRPDLGDGAPARVRVRVDGRARHDGPVPEAEVLTIPAGTLASGSHRVEAELDPRDPAQRCAVRARGRDGEAIASVRPTRWWVARTDEALELIVLGPTTLAIEGRSDLHGGARSVTLTLGRGDDPVRDLGVMELPRVADPRAEPELGRSIQPGLEAIRVITVVESGPHRLRVAPSGGDALVRVLGRVDGGDPPPARRVRPPLELGALVAGVDDVALPPLAEPRVAAAPPERRIGTITADLRVGSDDLEDADDLASRPGATLRLGYARELVRRRLWIAARGELRPRQDTALAGGGGLTIQGVIPRAGLRVSLGGLALTQAYGDGQAWSLRGALHVDRPTWVAPRLQLLPRLDVLGRLQSLEPGERVADERAHPRIYQRYVHDHPLVVLPGLDLRIQPWRDARVIVGVEAAPNSDLQGLDHASAHVGLYGALAVRRRLVPEFWLEEQLSYRLRDDDRARAFLRSRLRAGVGLGFWASPSARIVVGGADTLYVSTRFPVRNVVELWLRVDFVFGRGLGDLGPLGVAFRPIRERRRWREGRSE